MAASQHLAEFIQSLSEEITALKAGKKTAGQVVSVQGLEVHMALERSFGQSIPDATIRVKLWAILDLIRKKTEEARGAFLDSFAMSEKVFAGQRVSVTEEHPFYDNSTSLPNASQIQAIVAAYQHSLQIIWGPSRTGKTLTIAKLVEAHVNAGNRVLLVSHANTAVD